MLVVLPKNTASMKVDIMYVLKTKLSSYPKYILPQSVKITYSFSDSYQTAETIPRDEHST